jgi:hypothetical protein
MWSRLYRNHFIMAFPSYDTATSAWAPQADISWCTGPTRESEFVRFPNRVMSEAEAIACALDNGQLWIDSRLKRLPSGVGTRRGRVIEMVGALKESLTKETSKQPRRAQSTERRLDKTFTFNEFKSVIAASGLRISDPILQKSYGALVKLRKNRHWSWAEAKRKVEHSQQALTASRSSERRPPYARIPLTEREWRRMS